MDASGRREAKQIVAGLFGRVAVCYDRAGFLHESARHLVARVPLRPGALVLDVATGTGVALLAAARAGGPSSLLDGLPGRGRLACRGVDPWGARSA